MGFNREKTLRKAERLLRKGRTQAAIAALSQVHEHEPRDWTSAISLGDLYVESGDVNKGIALYRDMGQQALDGGILPRAAAVYRKILRIHPDDDLALLQMAEVTSLQRLQAESRAQLWGILEAPQEAQRDEPVAPAPAAPPPPELPGAVDCEEYLRAARVVAETGARAGAAAPLRAVAVDLSRNGREADALRMLREAVRLDPGDTAGRTQLVQASLTSQDPEADRQTLAGLATDEEPGLRLALAELDLRARRDDAGRQQLQRILDLDADGRDSLLQLGWTLGGVDEDASFTCIDVLVGAAVAADDWGEAAALLRHFLTRAPGVTPAALNLVEVCVDGGLQDQLRDAWARLAEAERAGGRVEHVERLAEDLEPIEPGGAAPAHIDLIPKPLAELRGQPSTEEAVEAGVGAGLPGGSDAIDRLEPVHEVEEIAPEAPVPAELVAPPLEPPRPSGAEAEPTRDVPRLEVEEEEWPSDVLEGLEQVEQELDGTTPIIPTTAPAPPGEIAARVSLAAPTPGGSSQPADEAKPPLPTTEELFQNAFVAFEEALEASRRTAAEFPTPGTPTLTTEPAPAVEAVELDALLSGEPVEPPAALEPRPVPSEPPAVVAPPAVATGADVPPVVEPPVPSEPPAVVAPPVVPAGADVPPVARAPVPVAPPPEITPPAVLEATTADQAPTLPAPAGVAPPSDVVPAPQVGSPVREGVGATPPGEGVWREEDARELEAAATVPAQRFEATCRLGRLCRDNGMLSDAVGWFQRAALARAPTPEAGLALRYDLADALEGTGQPAQALAVFRGVHSEAADYRDVVTRIGRLSELGG